MLKIFFHTLKLAPLAVLLILSACLGLGTKPIPEPFNSPTTARLIRSVPFFPDETNLCGPASLAAVMTFQGLPTTAAQASEALTRPNLRGTVTPDLVLWARNKGLKARFWSSQPDELIKLIDQQKPVIVQINAGITGLPYKLGHFAVAVGYLPEGIVANSGGVQQSIIPWSEFLTRWFAFGNLAILIEKPGEESQIQDLRPQSPVSPAPLITLDRPQ